LHFLKHFSIRDNRSHPQTAANFDIFGPRNLKLKFNFPVFLSAHRPNRFISKQVRD